MNVRESSTFYTSPRAELSWSERFRSDPRHYQLATLLSLLAYGAFVLHFDQTILNVLLIFSSGFLFQWIASRLWNIPFDPKSTLISSCSLSLLLRASHPVLLITGSAIAVFSKFLIRVNGKHVFNPANLAIAALALITGECWICPGQWGSGAIIAATFACAGILVITRAQRADVTLAFLGFFAGSLFLRAWYLNDPWSIPLHQLFSGSLFLFAFFMISDPKTTPDSRLGRILFALLVVLLAYYIRFKLYEPNALMYALIFCSMLVPVIDIFLPGKRFGSWKQLNPVTT